MTKREKLEKRIRNNMQQVRFKDLDTLMNQYKFDGDRSKPHVVYTHSTYPDIITSVAKPHGGTNHVREIYVRKALDAIDIAKARS